MKNWEKLDIFLILIGLEKGRGLSLIQKNEYA